MSTVGRIGWMRALTKVLTRSRGTPAAAFAMYCSRNVLVDKGLSHYKTRGREGGKTGSTTSRLLASCLPVSRLLVGETGPGVARDPEVLVNRARDARVDRAGAADRRAQVHH